ncbi:MAG: dockerin type I domain-containing protein [Planctomycetota bacterium]
MHISGPSLSVNMIRPTLRNAATASVPVEQIQPAADQTPQLGGTMQAPVDAATIMQYWGTSNALADLNVDGIVDAQDLAMASASPTTGTGAVTGSWGQAGGTNDLNGDGNVDAQDLALSLNNQAASAQSAAWQNAAGGDHNGDGTVNAMDLAMSLANPARVEESPKEMVNRLADAAFEMRDADADGVLTVKDFNGNERLFKRLDLDGNGSVNRDEMMDALMQSFDRFRENQPGSATGAFAKRWFEAFAGMRGAPELQNIGMARKYMQAGLAERGAPEASGRLLAARA